MAGQRMTRDAFDAVVQSKMKKFRVSMDQAISDTLREVEGPSTARRPANDFESYRDQQRYSMRDHPHSSADRSWDMEIRRDNVSNQPYLHELDREPSGGRMMNNFVDRWGPTDPIAKERFYREQLTAADRRLGELGNLRSLDREEFLSRDLSLNHGNWQPDLAMGRSEVFRDLRSQSQLGHMQDVFKSQGSMGQVPIKHREKSFGRPGEPYSSQHDLNSKPSGIDDQITAYKRGLQIIKWAKFNMPIDLELQKQKAEFKVNTVTSRMVLDCLKEPMALYHKNLCFKSVKHPIQFALKTPTIDNELLNLLVAKRVVATKNDFFEAIKPFDKDMMMVQQHLLKCILPLAFASNTFELTYCALTDPRQLFSALKSTVSLCQQSIVLISQTFAMITSARQANILNVLGVSDSSLKHSDCPNMKKYFLFGSAFILRLTEWLKNKDNKLTLKSTTRSTANTNVAKKEELKTNAESQERKAADPKVVATIDQLLESAKKGIQSAGGKSEFWFLFDEGSNEYKYYRQKFEEFQQSKGQIQTQSTQTKKCKRSPEELACESVRAMLYARKAQKVKRRLFRSLAFSRKRKQAKLKSRQKKTTPVKVEVINDEKQEPDFIPTKETRTKNSACEAAVQSEKTPDKCSMSDNTDAQVEELPKKKEPILEAPPDVDEKTVDTAIKLAQFVAQMGPEIEQFSMENSVNNPEFWFLCDKDSSAYKFYKRKVEEFKQGEEEATTDDEEIGLEDCDLENIMTGEEPQNESDVEMDAECEAAEAPSTQTTQVAAFSQMPTPARPPMARKRVANLKVGMLPPKRVCLVEESKIHDPVRIEYERPQGRGYNRKKKPVDLEFANKKLTQQNVGFKMLNKMGWQEGQGLGYRGSGIKNPINVGTISAGEGLGAEEKKAGNSPNFDAFRQRMMQMYRQKTKNEIVEEC